jgi:hypothetical protein
MGATPHNHGKMVADDQQHSQRAEAVERGELT